MENRSYSQVNVERPNEDVSETFFQKQRCCFCFSWSSNRSSTAAVQNWWQRVRVGENTGDNSLWVRGINAFKKLREWSEIVAGPRWKTFIRRFNRSSSRRNSSNCRYDALSYALNFDEGPCGQSGNLNEEDDYRSANFSVRYASTRASAKTSMDLGKDGTTFV